MRTLGTTVFALLALSGTALADETVVAIGQDPAAQAASAAHVAYPLEWQRRLLAVQLAFAATLSETDPMETGSINPLAQ